MKIKCESILLYVQEVLSILFRNLQTENGHDLFDKRKQINIKLCTTNRVDSVMYNLNKKYSQTCRNNRLRADGNSEIGAHV